MTDKSIPDCVSPIREIIFRAFGNPPVLTEFEYRAILIILYSHFSDRALADVARWTFGKDYLDALHDVYSVGSDPEESAAKLRVSEEEMDSVKEKLRRNGFEEWLKNNPPLI